ncbi:hypothetical protein QE152_g8970 [Popillia japonica]|uniref:Uncharacterized protein n=1 Tax=Popillia japonica TaxID=7064 RepID=A0AAW1LZV3_POPJA
MVWGRSSRDAVGELVRIQGIMDQYKYRDIFQALMLPHGNINIPPLWVFKHAPPVRERETKACCSGAPGSLKLVVVEARRDRVTESGKWEGLAQHAVCFTETEQHKIPFNLAE